MRVLIVDDESAARRRLSILLDELDVEVVGEASNGLEALEMIRERAPDLVLLDISMPEIDGLDVVRHLDEPHPLIVFQTAYDEYALEAFAHEAVDYLVKPIEREALTRAIERSRKRLDDRRRRRLTRELLEQLRSAVSPARPTSSTRLLVRERFGHRLLAYADVVRFYAEDGVVFAETSAQAGGGTFLTDYTLRELEGRTEGSFVRANRGELVNVDCVARIVGSGDGSARLTLTDGREIRVARRRAVGVRRALED